MIQKVILIVFFVICSVFTVNSQDNKFLLLFGDDDNLVKETNDYINRVKQNEGIVIDKEFINSLIKLMKKDGYFNKLSFWVSASGGLKLVNNFVETQFDISGKDITNNDVTARPMYIQSVIKNKPGILYDGINDYLENSDYKSEHPLTIIIVIKQNNEMNKEAILDSKKGNANTVYFKKGNETVEPLVVESGKKIEVGTIDTLVNIIIAEMNGINSKVYLNGDEIGNGKLTQGGFDGIIIGNMGELNKGYYLGGYNFECGVVSMILDNEKRNNLNSLLTKQYK